MCLGIPGQIMRITDPDACRGVVEMAGVQREIHLHGVVDERRPIEACVGDWVLVHVGFAIRRVDAREAASTLRLLRELDEMQQALGTIQKQSPAASGHN